MDVVAAVEVAAALADGYAGDEYAACVYECGGVADGAAVLVAAAARGVAEVARKHR